MAETKRVAFDITGTKSIKKFIGTKTIKWYFMGPKTYLSLKNLFQRVKRPPLFSVTICLWARNFYFNTVYLPNSLIGSSVELMF